MAEIWRKAVQRFCCNEICSRRYDISLRGENKGLKLWWSQDAVRTVTRGRLLLTLGHCCDPSTDFLIESRQTRSGFWHCSDIPIFRERKKKIDALWPARHDPPVAAAESLSKMSENQYSAKSQRRSLSRQILDCRRLLKRRSNFPKFGKIIRSLLKLYLRNIIYHKERREVFPCAG